MTSVLPLIAESLVSVGRNLSLDVRRLGTLAPQMVVLSLKYVDRRAVWDHVFPDCFVDWNLVQPTGNALGGLHLWLPLLETFGWEDLDRIEAQHPPLSSLRRALRAAALDNGSWDMPCQLLLLQWMQEIPCLQGFQLMTCRTLKRDTHQSCALLLAALSDSPYTPEVVAAALRAILSGDHLRVRTEALDQHLRAAQTRREDIRSALQQTALSAYRGRPRLRDRAQPSDEQKLRLDDALGTWESFPAFCALHQFPNVLSELIKSRLYFLASQTTWDWRPHTASVLRHEGDLSDRVGRYPVSRPDLPHIHRCIDALQMDGSPPFKELMDFRNRCFRSFPITTSQRLTLSQALRLYVCAYQNPALWKELWKAQISLLSPLIIKDCEAFVAQTPFAAAPFVALFNAGGNLGGLETIYDQPPRPPAAKCLEAPC